MKGMNMTEYHALIIRLESQCRDALGTMEGLAGASLDDLITHLSLERISVEGVLATQSCLAGRRE